MRSPCSQGGSLLIEAIASLAIFGILLASAFKYASERADDLKDQSAAQYQAQVMAAAKKYVLDNYSAVLAASTSTTPAVITMAMLQGTGYLPNSFQPSNSYAQTPCVLALQPSSSQIHALVVTEGGSAIPSKRTPAVAALIGATGGYIPSDSPTLARGAFGGWQLATTNFVSQNCSGTAAGTDHLAAAIFFDAGNVAPDYVYRGAVPGHPEFNSMTTPLSMKAVVTAGTSDGLCVVGDSSTYGRIAVDANGAVMSCQLGVWQKQTGSWKDPVANFAALPGSNNTLGDVRLITNLGRAFSWNGTAWIPLAVDQNGNLTVPGTVTFNQAQVNSVVTAGAACASTGLMARDSAGSLLSCQSGVWAKAISGGIGFYEFKINGYPQWFVGTGTYSSATGLFSGELICDPARVGFTCGSYGYHSCVGDPDSDMEHCSWGWANDSPWNGDGTKVYSINLRVNTVTQRW